MKRNRRSPSPRQCPTTGKACYESQGIAGKVIEGRLLDNPTLYLRAYRCKECGLFHTTHQPDKFRKEDAA